MKFSGLGVLFLVLVLLYLRYDKTGYYYGVECSFCNKNMPYGLTPKINFDYPQSFCLLDEDGFELVGIGFRYKQSSFRIKNFLGYAYNDTSVLLKCTDSLNNIKYLVSYETGYNRNKGHPDISFKDIDNDEYNKIKDNYQCIEIDEEKAKALSQKIKKAEFDYNDFLDQMHQIKKMGGMASIMNMMPGMNQLKGVDLDGNEKMMDRVEAIILSMTKEERANPGLMNPSRKQRIAKGAGVDIGEVNRLVKQFDQMKKMMKQMPGLMGGGKRKGMKGLGGLGGLMGGKMKLPF